MKKQIRLLLTIMLFLFSSMSNVRAYDLKGFADITYNKSTKNNLENKNGGFGLGQYDLYVSYPLDDRIDILGELVIESPGDGEFVVDLERLQIGYTFCDALKVRTGRIHNILGYWNTSYHHGAYLQTSAGRPSFLEFEDEGGILPVHTVGIWASGRINTNFTDIDYGVTVANGSQIRRDSLGANAALDPNSIGDNDRNKPVSFNFTLAPDSLPGFGIGLSGSNGHVQGFTFGILTEELSQTILGWHAFYTGKPVEILGEYFTIKNENRLIAATPSFTSKAYYVQAGYNVANLVTPYVRYEQVDVKSVAGVSPDPYFSALGSANSFRTIGGVRVDISSRSALKAEIRSLNVKNAEGKSQEYVAQWSFAF